MSSVPDQPQAESLLLAVEEIDVARDRSTTELVDNDGND